MGREKWRPLALATVLALSGAGAWALDGPDTAKYQPADIAAGASIFEHTCARCHGPNGDAVPNVSLGGGSFRHASSDRELQAIINGGIPGTGMIGQNLTNIEAGAVIAYLRNMHSFERGSVPVGDPDRGKALFVGKAECSTCHMVSGEGGVSAPDLTDIARTRRPSEMQRSIVDPSAGLMPINRPVRLVLKTGAVVTGRRLNEDTFTVEVMTEDGRLASYDKADLKDLSVSTTAKMPAYKDRLGAQEISDVLAYLMSLKG